MRTKIYKYPHDLSEKRHCKLGKGTLTNGF